MIFFDRLRRVGQLARLLKTALTGNEVIPLEQSGTSYCITLNDLTAWVSGGSSTNTMSVGSGGGDGTVVWSGITGTPTTLTGYGITDAVPTSRTVNGHALSGNVTVTSSDLSLATVASTGSYADLSNKPSIPAAQVNSDWTASSGVAQILNKPSLATVATSGSYNDLSNKPSLATVATSGSYSDLTGKPTFSTGLINTSGTITADTGVMATVSYVNNSLTKIIQDCGMYDAAANSGAYPSTGGTGTSGAVAQGDLWTLSTSSGTGALAGLGTFATVRALVNSPGQTAANWAVGEPGFGYTPENVSNKSTSITSGSTDTQYTSAKAVFSYAQPKLTGGTTSSQYWGGDGAFHSLPTNAATVTGLSVTSGRTLSVSNNLTLSGTDGSTLNIGTGGTLGTAAFVGTSFGGNSSADAGEAVLFDLAGDITATSNVHVGGTAYSDGTITVGGSLLTIPNPGGFGTVALVSNIPTASTGITNTSGAWSVTYGTMSNTACVGNDARLSNARTPTAHASTHATGGSDALTAANIGALASASNLSDVASPQAALLNLQSYWNHPRKVLPFASRFLGGQGAGWNAQPNQYTTNVGASGYSAVGLLSGTNTTSQTSRIAYWAQVAAKDVQIIFGNYLAQPYTVPNNINVKASVEYNGLLFPVFFGGKRTVELDSGAVLLCDPIPGLALPQGAEFFVRTYVSVTSGGQFPLNFTTTYNGTELVGASANTDYTDGGTNDPGSNTSTVFPYSNSWYNVFGPTGLVGHQLVNPPRAIMFAGDSISIGVDSSLYFNNLTAQTISLWGSPSFSVGGSVVTFSNLKLASDGNYTSDGNPANGAGATYPQQACFLSGGKWTLEIIPSYNATVSDYWVQTDAGTHSNPALVTAWSVQGTASGTPHIGVVALSVAVGNYNYSGPYIGLCELPQLVLINKPNAGDWITISGKVNGVTTSTTYLFVTTAAAPNATNSGVTATGTGCTMYAHQVTIGNSGVTLPTVQANLVAAINGTDSYAWTAADPNVTALPFGIYTYKPSSGSSSTCMPLLAKTWYPSATISVASSLTGSLANPDTSDFWTSPIVGLGNRLPYILPGTSGEYGVQFASLSSGITLGSNSYPPMAKFRINMIDMCTHFVWAYGANDIRNGLPLSQLQTAFMAVWKYVASLGVKVYAVTVTPYVLADNANCYLTVASQVPNNAAYELVRLQYNAWLRTCPAPLAGVIDACAAVAANCTNTTFLQAGGAWQTACTAAGTTAAAAPAPQVWNVEVINGVTYSLTGDGLHPGWYGEQLYMSAFDINNFW